ncbi:hypothetical protein BLM14_16820 [Phyllobacterium zundukense]|nr:hypothetical protein BLM14_16820 [Phyllobacterium zundukense]
MVFPDFFGPGLMKGILISAFWRRRHKKVPAAGSQKKWSPWRGDHRRPDHYTHLRSALERGMRLAAVRGEAGDEPFDPDVDLTSTPWIWGANRGNSRALDITSL